MRPKTKRGGNWWLPTGQESRKWSKTRWVLSRNCRTSREAHQTRYSVQKSKKSRPTSSDTSWSSKTWGSESLAISWGGCSTCLKSHQRWRTSGEWLASWSWLRCSSTTSETWSRRVGRRTRRGRRGPRRGIATRPASTDSTSSSAEVQATTSARPNASARCPPSKCRTSWSSSTHPPSSRLSPPPTRRLTWTKIAGNCLVRVWLVSLIHPLYALWKNFSTEIIIRRMCHAKKILSKMRLLRTSVTLRPTQLIPMNKTTAKIVCITMMRMNVSIQKMENPSTIYWPKWGLKTKGKIIKVDITNTICMGPESIFRW